MVIETNYVIYKKILVSIYFLICRWFHGKITRDEAETLLNPRKNGLFLVRESTHYPGDYTLCVCIQGKVEHYRIIYEKNQRRLTIDEEVFFQTLPELVRVSGVRPPVANTQTVATRAAITVLFFVDFISFSTVVALYLVGDVCTN